MRCRLYLKFRSYSLPKQCVLHWRRSWNWNGWWLSTWHVDNTTICTTRNEVHRLHVHQRTGRMYCVSTKFHFYHVHFAHSTSICVRHRYQHFGDQPISWCGSVPYLSIALMSVSLPVTDVQCVA